MPLLETRCLATEFAEVTPLTGGSYALASWTPRTSYPTFPFSDFVDHDRRTGYSIEVVDAPAHPRSKEVMSL